MNHLPARWQPREQLKFAPYTFHQRLLCSLPRCSGELPSFLYQLDGVAYFMLDGWQQRNGIWEKGRALRRRRPIGQAARRIPPGREVVVGSGRVPGQAPMVLPALVRCPRRGCGWVSEVLIN